jgi:mRNA interferase MazF
MKKFEVWLADLDPSFGTEAGKVRPVVIIQTNKLNGKHNSTVVCPITTKLRPASIFLRIKLISPEGGITHDSEIMVDQIRAIGNTRLIKKLGVIDIVHQQELENKIKIVLDLT